MYTAIRIPKGDWIQGRYRVTEVLGIGARSTCFRVEDRKNRNATHVCKVKRLRDGTQEAFETEIAALMKCRGSSCFPQVSDSFVNLSHRVIVLSFEGETIEDVLKRNRNMRFSNSNNLRISSQLTGALSFLHSTGYLHRNLTKDNILLKRSTNHVLVSLVDLGKVSLTTTREKCEFSSCWTSYHVASGKHFAERDDYISSMYLIGELAGFRLIDFIDHDLDEFKKIFHSRPTSFFKEPEKWIGRIVEYVDVMPCEGTKINMNEMFLLSATAIDNVSPHSPIAYKTVNNAIKVQ
ncbi:hypothetical protein L5515_017278 [Caenorhabditis briggsae]|uniref:Protein kinase domain-containing protein n=1 Tax=Caenorhabditis briggsae TaxID=6238 RepID=A0AAE9FJ48_CAEBR|nr:hypothetical protein L5515_017278 [Caenorhabditis briggsae]